MDLETRFVIPGSQFQAILLKGWSAIHRENVLQFLRYAKGSCGELRTQIYIGINMGYVPKEADQAWINETRELLSMLVGLMKAIQKQ